MLKIGDEVTFYDPGVGLGHESWQRGKIERILAECGGFAIHRVRLDAHKWIAGGEWGPYDGVPLVIGREVPGCGSRLEFCEVWRRGHHKDSDEFGGWIENRVTAGGPPLLLLDAQGCSRIIGSIIGGLHSGGLASVEDLRRACRMWADNDAGWEFLRQSAGGIQQMVADFQKGGRR